jgi:hypothetical protein
MVCQIYGKLGRIGKYLPIARRMDFLNGGSEKENPVVNQQ